MRANKSLTVDVRTGSKVSQSQALANAEDFAMRKLGVSQVFVRETAVTDVKPNFSIGPRK